MKPGKKGRDNLLLRLFSYTPRLGREPLEDFCTEALAWCLRNSPEFLQKFLNLTGVPRLRNCEGRVEVHTQLSYTSIRNRDCESEEPESDTDAPGGRFDLVIESISNPQELEERPSFVVVFESKTGLDIKDEQLERYRKELEATSCFENAKERFLVSLTKSNTRAPRADAHVGWSMVWQALTETAEELKHIPHRSQFAAGKQVLCEQFAEFLKEKGLGPMNLAKVDRGVLQNWRKVQSFKTQLEGILAEVRKHPLLKPILKTSPDFDPSEDDAGTSFLGIYNRGTPFSFYIGFGFSENDAPDLFLYVQRRLRGDQREAAKGFSSQLRKAFDDATARFPSSGNLGELEDADSTDFSFIRRVDDEYDGKPYKMIQWFVETCEEVVKVSERK